MRQIEMAVCVGKYHPLEYGIPPPKRPKYSKSKEDPEKVEPRGAEVLESRENYIASSQKLHYGDFPLNIVRGEAQFLIDESGQKYLDTTNNVACVGHCHPKVVEACCKQVALLNTNSRFLNERICTYAKKLCSTFPQELSCCFFTNSGSEANDLALQIARVVTKRQHVISIQGCYHGHVSSVKLLSDYSKARGVEKSEDVTMVSLPDVYRGKHQDPDTAGPLYALEIRDVLEKEKDGVAAFIHESMLSCAGQIIPPKNYLKDSYKYIHDAGGLVIADEIQTGFGRVGKHFWAFQEHGVVPDIVTLGKPMGNGHPVSAVVTTKEIAKKFADCGVEYFNTFGGNPVSMAIAEAVLDVIKEEKLQERSRELGEFMMKELLTLKEKHRCIGDVRGVGMFIGVDLVKDKETKEPNKLLASCFSSRMLQNHIIAFVDGVHGATFKIKPPLVFTKEDCVRLLGALDSVLNEWEAVN